MNHQNKFRHRRRKHQRKAKRHQGLEALFTAALAISGLGLSCTTSAFAQSPAEGTMSLQYWDYYDAQRNGQRVRAHSPMLSLSMPAGDRNTIDGSFVLDSVSGASPYYLSTLSGASGMGITENRKAGDIKFTHSFDRFSIGVGADLSTEKDYDSLGGSVETRIWSEDKNTTFAFGVGGNSDKISSSIDANLNESKHAENFLVGITQVLNPDAILQSNITFTGGRGYFSDPYKPLDNRPNSHDQWAWLTRYNQFIEEFNASLHLDYRLYADSYGVNSHMVEAAWYQPISETWLLRPSVRYYTQSKANFFHDTFPPTDTTQLYTADQRLSAFGGVSGGLKLVKELGDGYSAEVSADYLMQQQDLRPGSSGTSDILPFHAVFWSIGLSKKF